MFLQSSSIFEGFGGIEYYLHDLETLSVEALGEPNVVALIPDRTGSPKNPDHRYAVTFVPFARKGWRQKLQNRFSLAMYRSALQEAERLKPTLIVAGHVAMGPLAYVLSRKLHIPYTTLVYGIECWSKLWPQDEWCLRESTGIISISHWTKKVLVDRGYDAGRIQIVQPQLPSLYESVQPFTRPHSDRPFTLLTVSRLDAKEQYKGQDHVMQAMAKLRSSDPGLKLRYVIQGDGDDKPRLAELSQTLGLSDCVEFRAPFTDRKELEQVYREADLYVMPSRFGLWEGRWRGEGFGIVYLEAAAFGLPSVAYACGGAMDIIRQGDNGILVKPDDINELARTFGSLAADRTACEAMGRRAYVSVMTNFTRPAIRRQLTEALGQYS